MGYLLEYDLYSFFIEYDQKYSYTEGTCFFTELKGGKAKNNNWKKNRVKAYKGSVMHFIRSVYQGEPDENGFVINRLIREENPAYAKFKKETDRKLSGGEPVLVIKVPDKIIQTLIDEKVTYSQLRSVSNNKVYLDFDGFYYVEYLGEKEDKDFVRWIKGQDLIGNQNSVISLEDDRKVEIDKNENFYPASDLFLEGYFTWKKIANLLPLDYRPDSINLSL